MEQNKNKKRMRIYTTIVIMLVIMIAFNKFGRNSLEDYMEAGEKYYAEGKYEDAFDSYMRAIEKDSQMAAAYEGAASSLLSLERLDEAEDILKRGVQETDDGGLERLLEEVRGKK